MVVEIEFFVELTFDFIVLHCTKRRISTICNQHCCLGGADQPTAVAGSESDHSRHPQYVLTVSLGDSSHLQ